MFMSEILGDIVVYSLSNDISINRQELEDRVKSDEVLKVLVPKCMGIATAFRKATDEAIRGYDGIELREVPARFCPDNSLVRNIELVEYTEGQSEPSIKQVATMCLDKETGEIHYNLYKKSLGATIVDKSIKEFHRLYSKILTIKEIREYIQRTLYCCYSVKLRRNGGIDFVPEKTFDCLENLIKSLDGFVGIDFTRISVSNIEKNRISICKFFLKQMDDYLKDEIFRLTHKVSTVENIFLPVREFTRALFSTNAGIAVINRMLQRFNIAVIKVDIYTDLLSKEMDANFLSKMKEAKEELEIALDERKEWES